MTDGVPELEPREGIPAGGVDLAAPVLARLREFTTAVAQAGAQSFFAVALGRDGRQTFVSGYAPGGNISLIGLALQGLLVAATSGMQEEIAALNRAVVEAVDRMEGRVRTDRAGKGPC